MGYYKRDRTEKKLPMRLKEAEEAVKDDEGWLNLDELEALLGMPLGIHPERGQRKKGKK